MKVRITRTKVLKQDGGGDDEDDDVSSDVDGNDDVQAESSDSEIPGAEPSPKRKEKSVHHSVMDDNGLIGRLSLAELTTETQLVLVK
jgi:hypothetical protein